MSAHTPGPWLTDRNNTHAAQIATIYHCINNDWVEVWTPEAFGVGEETREANARLISAAPDLLEALIEFSEAMRQANDTPHLIDNTHALQLAVNSARSAITKVTGATA